MDTLCAPVEVCRWTGMDSIQMIYRRPSRHIPWSPCSHNSGSWSSCDKATSFLVPYFCVDGYAALLRARRRKEKGWDSATREKCTRHRWRVEGVHERAKSQHGLRRAARRGLAEVRIQSYLTTAAMNLKRLAALIWDSAHRFFIVLRLFSSIASVSAARKSLFHARDNLWAT